MDSAAVAVEKHATRQRRHIHIKTRLIARLKTRPCADCQGWFEPCQMEFDHRPGMSKFRDISRMRAYSTRNILEEISKCDVVCANCHRLRTFKRVLRRD